MINPIRVLIVDDSATMRALLKSELECDPAITVIGGAENPIAARKAIRALKPDVLTLDINMPGMDGLEFLEKIMRLRPMPVLVVSSEVKGQSQTAIDALALGAFGCFPKPMAGSMEGVFDGLRDSVVRAANLGRPTSASRYTESGDQSKFDPSARIVAIGASTGGVEALATILSDFPANCPPTVVTQHMPASFTASFANRLDRMCAASVSEATRGAVLEPGKVYIAPGGAAHLEVTGREKLICNLNESPAVTGHRPSVDVLFASIARIGAPATGIILTGMGEDGARGLLAMRKAGAYTIGQDESTSLVYGMPHAAFKIGAVEKQLPLGSITKCVLQQCCKSRSRKKS